MKSEQEKRDELYRKWKELVNMSARELELYLKTDEAKEDAGLSAKEAKKLGIKRGYDSGKAIVRMKRKGVKKWTKKDWEWAKRQVSFNSRMLGAFKRVKARKGKYEALFDSKTGKRTPLHQSLLIWGHNPMKYWS